VDKISRSRLLAAETSKLKFLADYSLDDPAAAIVKVELEQIRLFDIMSKSFDGLRQEADILQIKAFHDSFRVLSEIIGSATENIMSNAKLSAPDYERLNTLIHNQHLLISMNEVLQDLAKELKSLTYSLSQKTVEGLDTLLLTVKDLAHSYDDAEVRILKSMTSEEHQGLARIRETYLSEETGLDADTKALLLSCTNHIDRLRTLFGSVGDNYRKLAGLAEGSAAA
jgi:hypothetical protein